VRRAGARQDPVVSEVGDSSHSPEFAGSRGWSERYRSGETPWDQGGPHPELVRRLAAGELAPSGSGRALVGGAGRGHDALALARAGWRVLAVDFAEGLPPSVDEAFAAADSRFLRADALALEDDPFDLVFEHTFFCALDPADRPRWGAMVRRLTLPGARVVAVAFPANKPRSEGGPPHGTTPADLAAALGDDFELVLDVPCVAGCEGRVWEERWVEVRRLNR
jgi:hypothetical protein